VAGQARIANRETENQVTELGDRVMQSYRAAVKEAVARLDAEVAAERAAATHCVRWSRDQKAYFYGSRLQCEMWIGRDVGWGFTVHELAERLDK
jgi:hypothetical protein